jgi:hypothetical protein
MSKDWQPIETAPRDGTLLHLWCPGVGSNPKPYECDGRFIGVGWASFVDDCNAGLIDPRKWKLLDTDDERTTRI